MSLLTGSHALHKPITRARAGNTIGLLLELVAVISTQATQLNMEQQGIPKEAGLLFGGVGELETGEEPTGVWSLSALFCFLLLWCCPAGCLLSGLLVPCTLPSQYLAPFSPCLLAIP